MDSKDFDEIERRLIKEKFGGYEISWRSFILDMTYLSRLRENDKENRWGILDEMSSFVTDGEFLYLQFMDKGQIYVQPLEGDSEPTCFRCDSNLAFKNGKLLRVYQELPGEDPEEIPAKFPYCPKCEDEPEDRYIDWV